MAEQNTAAVGLRTGHSGVIDAGGSEDGGLDAALSVSGEVEVGRRWVPQGNV